MMRQRFAPRQRKPAARDAIRHPGSDQQQKRHREHDAKNRCRQQQRDAAPEQRPPEGADLPAEVRLEQSPGRVRALQIIQHDRDDRGPAGDEGGDYEHRRGQAGEHGDRVQGIDHVRPRRQPFQVDVHAQSPRPFHRPSTRRFTSSDIAMALPQRRAVSAGHLWVASIPIFEPRPATGLAKSR